MNDPVSTEEEDSLSRKLFERTESLLGRFHTSKKPSTGSNSREASSENLLGRFHSTKKPSTGSRDGSPESHLGRFHGSKQKENPSCKRQKTDPKMQGMTGPPKMQELTSPPKMQGITSPRLKREGSKRKTKVAGDVFDQIFT